MSCMVGSYFWVPARYSHWWSQVDCITRYWELTWRNWDSLLEGQRGREDPREEGQQDLPGVSVESPGSEEGKDRWSAGGLLQSYRWEWGFGIGGWDVNDDCLPDSLIRVSRRFLMWSICNSIVCPLNSMTLYHLSCHWYLSLFLCGQWEYKTFLQFLFRIVLYPNVCDILEKLL